MLRQKMATKKKKKSIKNGGSKGAAKILDKAAGLLSFGGPIPLDLGRRHSNSSPPNPPVPSPINHRKEVNQGN